MTTNAYTPQPPPDFATTQDFVAFHFRLGLSNGLREQNARERAMKALKQEIASFVEPQWKSRPRFGRCGKCGASGHWGPYCRTKDLQCEYCNTKGSHNTIVCQVLHGFCFRCSVFGHRANPDLNARCVRLDREAEWNGCKSKGLFTKLQAFEHSVRWDHVADEVKRKFGEHMELAKPYFSPLILYALERADNPDHDTPWAWYKQTPDFTESGFSKKRAASSERPDSRGNFVSKRGRGEFFGARGHGRRDEPRQERRSRFSAPQPREDRQQDQRGSYDRRSDGRRQPDRDQARVHLTQHRETHSASEPQPSTSTTTSGNDALLMCAMEKVTQLAAMGTGKKPSN